jgi:hypothetical protein
MVKIAPSRRKRIQFHNFSTWPCGLGEKTISEQTLSDGDSVKEEKNKPKSIMEL